MFKHAGPPSLALDGCLGALDGCCVGVLAVLLSVFEKHVLKNFTDVISILMGSSATLVVI